MSDASSEGFARWLAGELERRGWIHAEFARRAGLSQAQVSRVLSGESAGRAFCRGAARALGLPPPKIFRKAGLLPSYPTTNNERQQFMESWDALDEHDKACVARLVEALLWYKSFEEGE